MKLSLDKWFDEVFGDRAARAREMVVALNAFGVKEEIIKKVEAAMFLFGDKVYSMEGFHQPKTADVLRDLGIAGKGQESKTLSNGWKGAYYYDFSEISVFRAWHNGM